MAPIILIFCKILPKYFIPAQSILLKIVILIHLPKKKNHLPTTDHTAHYLLLDDFSILNLIFKSRTEEGSIGGCQKIELVYSIGLILSHCRVIFMENHILERPDRSLLLIGIQTSKWSLCDVVFHENYSILA